MLVDSLIDKRILITGASSGIGRQLAIDLSAHGASLVLVGRDRDKLHETLDLCHQKNTIEVFAKDLTDSDFIEEFSSKIPHPFDGVVFNAGRVKVNPVAFINKSEIDDFFDVNTKSSMLITQYLLRKKKIQAGGSFVFISSIATKKPTLGNAVYNASKGAINSFAHSLALEVASKKIRVNTVLPGFIDTNILGRVRSEEEIKKHLEEYPLGRFGQVQDVSHLVCFLLSDASSWITGAQIPIDGGFSMK